MYAIINGCKPPLQPQQTGRCCCVANHYHQQLHQQPMRPAAASSRSRQQLEPKARQCVRHSHSQHNGCGEQQNDMNIPSSSSRRQTPLHTQHTPRSSRSSTYSSSHGDESSSSRSSNGTSSSSGSSSSRRGLLLRSTLLPSLLLVGSDDATTIVNSILSGYGLPTLAPTKGFRAYDEFEDDYVFSYPRSWVARKNSLRPGVYIADFQTADKVAVEVLPAPADGDIQTAAVAAAVIPPGRQEDATLNLPAQRLIKAAPATVDGQAYLYLEFPSETTTRSGYNIKRKNFVVAGQKRDTLFVLSASARSDQYNAEKKEMLQQILQSFRLR